MDEAIYGNQGLWPDFANGAGASLERRSASISGNFPANWIGAVPTPGQGPPSGDRDGDGMPDDWEVARQLNPDDPRDAALDADHDGFGNLQEYLAGTDPRNPMSLLRFESVALSNGVVALGFTAVAGKSYTVLYRDSVGGGAWLKLKNIPAPTATARTDVTDGALSGQAERYYRLVTPSMP